MSNVAKTIENPEVPGLECLLPPPPPPPLISSDEVIVKPATIPVSSDKPADAAVSVEPKIGTAEGDQSSAKPSGNAAKSFVSENPPLFAGGMQAPYFVQPAAPPIPSVDQPWWVPNDSDTDGVPTNRTAWFDQSATWTDNSQTIVSPTSKAKGKFFKRKSECIDPAQDAERVANAQRELSALMKPLKCDLCNAIMNSTLQAKLHYEGKPHQKKVSMFLNQSVKKIKPDDGQVTSTTSTDWNTYCDVCKTWFTSQIDASQHYAGKKHIRATTGVTKHKTKKQQSQGPVDPTGRFGIGIPFSTEPQATILGSPELALAPPIVPPPALPPVVPTNNYQASTWPFPTFHCELCGVTANRLEQLETHKRGAKHIKMMKMNGIVKPEVEINNSTTQPPPSTIDYSIYRTPSGQYYCAPCNRSFHSENSFAQHVESKKHKTQVNPKQPAPPPATTKKTNKSK